MFHPQAKDLRMGGANDFGACPFGFWPGARLVGYMKDDQHRFLSLLGQLPVRLNAEQASWLLNCQTHDIPALMSARLLKPLGNPAQNSIKFFSTADVLELAKDRSWLAKLTNTINQHWQKKNSRKLRQTISGAFNGEPVELAA
jgi:hypothetical protein